MKCCKGAEPYTQNPITLSTKSTSPQLCSYILTIYRKIVVIFIFSWYNKDIRAGSNTRVPPRWGLSPPFMLGANMIKEFSIFIDESGDFDPFEPHSPFYFITMVFHDQNNNINNQIKTLDTHLGNLGLKSHYIHTGPLIRKNISTLRYKL